MSNSILNASNFKATPEVIATRSGQLVPLVYKLIDMLDHDKVVCKEDKLIMAKDIGDFVLASIGKYVAGQKEHGGRLINRDIDKDITNEIIDLFHYHRTNSKKHKKNNILSIGGG